MYVSVCLCECDIYHVCAHDGSVHSTKTNFKPYYSVINSIIREIGLTSLTHTHTRLLHVTHTTRKDNTTHHNASLYYNVVDIQCWNSSSVNKLKLSTQGKHLIKFTMAQVSRMEYACVCVCLCKFTHDTIFLRLLSFHFSIKKFERRKTPSRYKSSGFHNLPVGVMIMMMTTLLWLISFTEMV